MQRNRENFNLLGGRFCQYLNIYATIAGNRAKC